MFPSASSDSHSKAFSGRRADRSYRVNRIGPVFGSGLVRSPVVKYFSSATTAHRPSGATPATWWRSGTTQRSVTRPVAASIHCNS